MECSSSLLPFLAKKGSPLYFILRSYVDGLVPVNRVLVAKSKKAAKREIRQLYPNADKVIFSDDRICITGRNEVLRLFVERRTESGKLKPF